MRLTKEDRFIKNVYRVRNLSYEDLDMSTTVQEERQAIDKLGQLEDIEDELSIDLITLFKVLKNGFYYEIDYEDEFEKGFFKLNNTSMQIDFDKKAFVIEAQIFIYFKDYGKTWALTKEELK